MRRTIFNKSVFTIFLVTMAMATMNINAQENDDLKTCKEQIQQPFIPDGRDYSLEISQGKKAVLHLTLLGNTRYKLVACPSSDIGLKAKLYDHKDRLLFESKVFNDATNWDFKFKSGFKSKLVIEPVAEMTGKSVINLYLGYKPE